MKTVGGQLSRWGEIRAGHQRRLDALLDGSEEPVREVGVETPEKAKVRAIAECERLTAQADRQIARYSNPNLGSEDGLIDMKNILASSSDGDGSG